MSKLPDLLLFDQQLTEEELAIQKTVRDYCDKSLMPRIQKANSCLLYTSPSPRDDL